MSGSNFDSEIRNAMSPTSEAMPKKGMRPPPKPSSAHDGGAVATKAGSPHQFKPPAQTGQNGIAQAHAVPAPGMNGPTPQAGNASNLHQAHQTIINALASRDQGM